MNGLKYNNFNQIASRVHAPHPGFERSWKGNTTSGLLANSYIVWLTLYTCTFFYIHLLYSGFYQRWFYFGNNGRVFFFHQIKIPANLSHSQLIYLGESNWRKCTHPFFYYCIIVVTSLTLLYIQMICKLSKNNVLICK